MRGFNIFSTSQDGQGALEAALQAALDAIDALGGDQDERSQLDAAVDTLCTAASAVSPTATLPERLLQRLAGFLGTEGDPSMSKGADALYVLARLMGRLPQAGAARKQVRTANPHVTCSCCHPSGMRTCDAHCVLSPARMGCLQTAAQADLKRMRSPRTNLVPRPRPIPPHCRSWPPRTTSRR